MIDPLALASLIERVQIGVDPDKVFTRLLT